jgi:hypothetical protein
MKVGAAMSGSVSPMPLSSHHRRNLAAVVLRGELAAYETIPEFRLTVDRLIDELLESCGTLQENESWDVVTERIVARFARRLPQEQPEASVSASSAPGAVVARPRERFKGWGTMFMTRKTSQNYL